MLGCGPSIRRDQEMMMNTKGQKGEDYIINEVLT